MDDSEKTRELAMILGAPPHTCWRALTELLRIRLAVRWEPVGPWNQEPHPSTVVGLVTLPAVDTTIPPGAVVCGAERRYS